MNLLSFEDVKQKRHKMTSRIAKSFMTLSLMIHVLLYLFLRHKIQLLKSATSLKPHCTVTRLLRMLYAFSNWFTATKVLPVNKDGLVENLTCRNEKSVTVLVPEMKIHGE